MPVGSPKETYESAKQAGDAADATTGKAQSLVLGDPKSSDYKASTQQTMQSLQSEEPLKALIPLDHQVTEPAMLKALWPRLHCMLPTPIIK